VSVIEIRTAVGDELPRLRVVYRGSSWPNEGDRALIAAHPEFLELSPNGVRAGRRRAMTLRA
jgi:hypothetical protein